MDPGERPPKLIEQLRAEVERAPGGRLTDKELAALSIDPSTARRQFKRHYGMTFQAYHRARRMGLALREVRKGGRVDEAQNGSGFESASGFREAFTRIFGDPPTAAKARACMFAERIETPLGTMLAVADDAGLRLLEFADRRALERELTILRQRLKTNVVPGEHQVSRRDSDAARPVFLRRKSGVRHSAGADWIGVPNADLGSPAFDSGCAKPVPIRGWRSAWAFPARAARSAAPMGQTCFRSSSRAIASSAPTARFAVTAADSGERNGSSITSGNGSKSE